MMEGKKLRIIAWSCCKMLGAAIMLFMLFFTVGVGIAALLGLEFAPTSSSDLAGWAQAAGAVVSICVAYYIGADQAKLARHQAQLAIRQTERDAAVEVAIIEDLKGSLERARSTLTELDRLADARELFSVRDDKVLPTLIPGLEVALASLRMAKAQCDDARSALYTRKRERSWASVASSTIELALAVLQPDQSVEVNYPHTAYILQWARMAIEERVDAANGHRND